VAFLSPKIIWAGAVLIIALIEASWLSMISIQGVVPDLVLIMVVYFAITEGEELAMYTGVLGGMFQDVAANTVLGQHILCLVIIGYCIGRGAQRLVTDNPYVRALTVLIASVVQGMFFISLEYIQQVDSSAVFSMSLSVMPKAFYTALATPLIFYVVMRIRPVTAKGLT
jgi:rod shape-determining protein MreD